MTEKKVPAAEPDEKQEAKKPEPLVPTKAEDYPVAKDIELTLPSGARAKLHEPNKYVMLQTGQFPQDVEDAIRDVSLHGTPPSWEIKQRTLEILLCKAFIEPKLSMTPKKGHLCVKDLRDRDREFVVLALQLTVF